MFRPNPPSILSQNNLPEVESSLNILPEVELPSSILPTVASSIANHKNNQNNYDGTPVVGPLTNINTNTNNELPEVQSIVHNDPVDKTFLVNKYFENQVVIPNTSLPKRTKKTIERLGF